MDELNESRKFSDENLRELHSLKDRLNSLLKTPLMRGGAEPFLNEVAHCRDVSEVFHEIPVFTKRTGVVSSGNSLGGCERQVLVT